jgi:hypothetical protein
MTNRKSDPPFGVVRSIYSWIFLGVVVLLYELRTVLDRNPHTLPLTAVVTTWVPGALTMGFLTWLYAHFLIRYLQSGHWWFR